MDAVEVALHVARGLLQVVASCGASRQVVAATASALFSLVLRQGEGDPDVEHRLHTVKGALVMQKHLGVSHLQMVEKDPTSFGLDALARSRVRKLRQRRNLALHGGFDQEGVKKLTQCGKDYNPGVGTVVPSWDHTQTKLKEHHEQGRLEERASEVLTQTGDVRRPADRQAQRTPGQETKPLTVEKEVKGEGSSAPVQTNEHSVAASNNSSHSLFDPAELASLKERIGTLANKPFWLGTAVQASSKTPPVEATAPRPCGIARASSKTSTCGQTQTEAASVPEKEVRRRTTSNRRSTRTLFPS